MPSSQAHRAYETYLTEGGAELSGSEVGARWHCSSPAIPLLRVPLGPSRQTSPRQLE